MIQIVTPTLENIPQIIDLWNETDAYHHELDQIYYVQQSDGKEEEVKKYLEKAITKQEPEIRCAVIDKKFVGFITFQKGKADYFDTNINQYGEIIELYVTPSFREQGVGSQLIQEVEKYFKNQNIFWIKLQMSAYNKLAEVFYNSHGYIHRQSLLFKHIGE